MSSDFFRHSDLFSEYHVHNMDSPGQRIKRRRIELGFQQGELARMVGMSQSALSEVESGESKLPSADKLIKLSKVLMVTQEWIVTGVDGDLEVLSKEEEKAFAKLRKLTPDQRAAFLAMLDSYPIPKD